MSIAQPPDRKRAAGEDSGHLKGKAVVLANVADRDDMRRFLPLQQKNLPRKNARNAALLIPCPAGHAHAARSEPGDDPMAAGSGLPEQQRLGRSAGHASQSKACARFVVGGSPHPGGKKIQQQARHQVELGR